MKMNGTADDYKNMKNHMKPLFLPSQAHESRAEKIKHTAYTQLRKTLSADLPEKRHSREKHHSAGQDIDCHGHTLELLKEKNACDDTESCAAPAENQHHQTVGYA